jgi:hypothetical protein
MDFKLGFAYFAILVLALVISDQLNQYLDENKQTKRTLRDMYLSTSKM